MEKQELRIGNLVEYDSKIFKVKEIKDYIISCDRGKGNVDFTVKEIKPILLSEENILAFGFKHSGSGFYIHCESLIQLCNVGDLYFHAGYKDSSIRNIYHVHELQNLYFGIIGKDLTVKK